jgi:hypothetical protein
MDRARYWIEFDDEGVPWMAGNDQSSMVALEPEILGTWRVRVHYGGRQVFAVKGLEYPQALESLLGAFEVLARERGEQAAS